MYNSAMKMRSFYKKSLSVFKSISNNHTFPALTPRELSQLNTHSEREIPSCCERKHPQSAEMCKDCLQSNVRQVRKTSEWRSVMMLWREGVICIHLDTDASIIHRHCIIQPGSLSAKLPGSGDSGHSAQVASFIIPLSSSSTLSSPSHPREDTVTFPSWQPLICRVDTVSSLSPVRSIYRYSKKWIIFKDLNG